MAHRFIDGLPFLKMGGFSMANCEKSSDGKPRDPRDQWCAMFRTSGKKQQGGNRKTGKPMKKREIPQKKHASSVQKPLLSLFFWLVKNGFPSSWIVVAPKYIYIYIVRTAHW